MPSALARIRAYILLLSAIPALGGCGLFQQHQEPATVVPDAPVYCYRTLARVACYETPQQNVGTFVGTQQPVTVQKSTTLEDGSVLLETVTPADEPPMIPMPAHP